MSPDGKSIAFTMFVLDDGAQYGAPLKKPEGAKWAEPLKVISRLHYRQDGEGYLRPGYSHVFLVSAEGGSARQLTFGAHDLEGPLSWAPDGRSLLVSSNFGKDWERDPTNSEVFRLTVADGQLTPLTSRQGPDNGAQVSPDGAKIAYLGYDDHLRGYENVQVYLMNRDGSGSHALTGSLDRTVDQVRWAADGRSLFIQYTDKGVSKVGRLGLDGHVSAIAEGLSAAEFDRPYSGGQFSVSDKGVVAMTTGDPSTRRTSRWPDRAGCAA